MCKCWRQRVWSEQWFLLLSFSIHLLHTSSLLVSPSMSQWTLILAPLSLSACFSLTRLLQLTFLLVQVSSRGSSCWIYIASGCSIYKVEVCTYLSFPIDEGDILLKVSSTSNLKQCSSLFELAYLVLDKVECVSQLFMWFSGVHTTKESEYNWTEEWINHSL